MHRMLLALAVLALSATGFAGASPVPTIVTPDKTPWVAGTGPLAGTRVAVLSGDLQKPGPYTVRLELQPGTNFPPHFHGDTENVTVISGSLWVGLGDRAQPSQMIELPAGSFVSVPQGIHHYAMAKQLTVIQIHGMGPFTLTFVKP